MVRSINAWRVFPSIWPDSNFERAQAHKQWQFRTLSKHKCTLVRAGTSEHQAVRSLKYFSWTYILGTDLVEYIWNQECNTICILSFYNATILQANYFSFHVAFLSFLSGGYGHSKLFVKENSDKIYSFYNIFEIEIQIR